MRRLFWFGVILVVTTPAWFELSYAKVYHTKEGALKLAFSKDMKIEKKTVFLNASEKERIEKIARTKLEDKIYTFYVGKKDEKITGYAIFGTHVVRTKPEVYIAVINPTGSLRFIEILAFYEPEEYLPSKKWFKQFEGKPLSDDLWVKKGIHAVSGATMSADGIVREVRKSLAVFKIMILEEGK